MSTKKEILEYFKDINYAYNDSTRYDTLERMLSELEGEKMGNEERCVICGDIIPEGRQVCPICEGKYHKEKTNADHIRAMTDEELAEFLRNLTKEYQCAPECYSCEGKTCVEGWLEWLRKEKRR